MSGFTGYEPNAGPALENFSNPNPNPPEHLNPDQALEWLLEYQRQRQMHIQVSGGANLGYPSPGSNMGLTPTANAHDLAGGDLSHYPIMGTPMWNIGLVARGDLAQFSQTNMAGGDLSRISENGATFSGNENSQWDFTQPIFSRPPTPTPREPSQKNFGGPAGALAKISTPLWRSLFKHSHTVMSPEVRNLRSHQPKRSSWTNSERLKRPWNNKKSVQSFKW